MAECNDQEKCISEEKVCISSRLEQELLKCEAENKRRCFQLMSRLEHIKHLDEQIYMKQMAMHFPKSFAQDNAADPKVEQDPEQTTQNRVDQMIANFEHRIHKTPKEEEKDEENETKEEKDEENETNEEKQIQESGSDNWELSFESINDACSTSPSKSKSPNNACSSGSEELNQGLTDRDKEDSLTMAVADFQSKKLHFEKLIQKDLMITEQEISKRKRLLKK